LHQDNELNHNCIKKYYRADYENDGDNGGGGDADADIATVRGGGASSTKGNGNDLIVHIIVPQIVYILAMCNNSNS